MLADSSSPESLANRLGELRRAVMRLGDTGLTVLMHLAVGEMEGRRGALESASRHVHIASRLLQDYHNDWLQGLAEIDGSCLAYSMAEPGRQGLEQSVRSRASHCPAIRRATWQPFPTSPTSILLRTESPRQAKALIAR